MSGKRGKQQDSTSSEGELSDMSSEEDESKSKKFQNENDKRKKSKEELEKTKKEKKDKNKDKHTNKGRNKNKNKNKNNDDDNDNDGHSNSKDNKKRNKDIDDSENGNQERKNMKEDNIRDKKEKGKEGDKDKNKNKNKNKNNLKGDEGIKKDDKDNNENQKKEEGLRSKEEEDNDVDRTISKGTSSKLSTKISTNPLRKTDQENAQVGNSESSKVQNDEVISDSKTSSLLTVQDIIDALSIIVSSSKIIKDSQTVTLMDIRDMQIENPKTSESIDPEIFFEYDKQGRWCVMIHKQRMIKADAGNVDDYPTLLKHLHHIIEGTVKEFFRLFRIKKKIILGTSNIIDPLVIGFDDSINTIVKEDMRTMVVNNIQRFSYVSMGTHDIIPLVINPIFTNFHLNSQEYILRDRIDLRTWMERFSVRKEILNQFQERGIYGDNKTRWFSHAAPNRLPLFCDQLPNFNLVSVAYSSLFVVPECTLSEIDLTQVSQTLQSNANRAEPLTEVLTATTTDKNYEDFRRILIALTLSGQVMIDIDYDPHMNAILAGFVALIAKVLFSTSPGFRNVSLESARSTDLLIGDMLTTVGYSQEVQGEPLNVESRRYPEPALWQDLNTTDESGAGWINTNVNASIRINDPLYEGINLLPVYGGVTQFINVENRIDASEIDRPPIWGLIMRNLNNASARREVVGMKNLFGYIESKYMQFLINLNRFIVRYGETGFRLSDLRRREMIGLFGYGGLNESMNAPVRINIASDSIYKFFLRLPSVFKPNRCVLRQPLSESCTSAEIQRIFSIYIAVNNWVRNDGRDNAFVRRRIFKLMYESIESNHIAKKILTVCLAQGDIQRMNFNNLEAAINYFDDFESIFFPEMGRIVQGSPEHFGLTREISYAPTNIRIPLGAAYEEAADRGIIASNEMYRPVNKIALTWEIMQNNLNQKDLIYRMQRRRSRERLVTTLPIYVKYVEYRGSRWMPETDAWIVTIPNSSSYADVEMIKPGIFTRQIIYPPLEGPAFPDQYLLNGCFLSFWYVGDVSLTETAIPGRIMANWLVDTTSFKDFVIYKSPLLYEGQTVKIKDS